MGVSRDRLEGFRKGRTGTLGRIGEEQSEISENRTICILAFFFIFQNDSFV